MFPSLRRPRSRALLALPATAALSASLIAVAPAGAVVVDKPVYDQAKDASAKIAPIGSYDAGVFDESGAEIAAYHKASKRVLTVNANSGKIDVLDIADPTAPTKVGEVHGGDDTTINSVAVREDGLAVATVEPDEDKTKPGEVIFFDAGADTPGEVLGRVGVGSLPDMVTLTPNGRYALVANEGEPAEDYSVDPEGSISLIRLEHDVAAPTQDKVRTADFSAFEGTLADKGVRIFGQVGASQTEAQNLEPEYIAVDGNKAYVTLQENNAIAVVDITSGKVEDIWPLGVTDRREVPFDASDKDGTTNISKWPVKSLLQPDSIAAYNVDGETYLVLANEGDSRDWDGYSEEARLKKFGKKDVAPICEGYAGLSADQLEELQSDEQLGRLNMTTSMGLNEKKGCYDDLYNLGGRSFSIFTADGKRVFDSGSQFEEITSRILPEYFNSNHTETSFDTRSDDKGPEPEGVTVGEVNGRTYAFIGFERLGGVMVYDITDPSAPKYQAYVNNRDFSINMEALADEGEEQLHDGLSKVGDLGAEGLTFIPAADSPNGEALLAVGNEVSGTTTLFQVESLLDKAEEPEETPGEEPGEAPEKKPEEKPDSPDQQTGDEQEGSSTAGKVVAAVTGVLAALVALVAGGVSLGLIQNPVDQLLGQIPGAPKLPF